MRLIIGPTSAGKSSYIQGLTGEDAAKPKVYFAHQVQKSGNIPTGDNDVVHYNLLHGVKGRREAARLGESELLHNLIDAASDVVVLSAPRSVLLERSGSRVLAEPDHPGHAKRRYDQELWEKALRAPDLAQVYEHLGLLLDEATASHEYYCTNAGVHGEITPIARWDFPQLARDDAQELCRKGHRLPDQAERERSYQTDHRIGGVSATLSHALVMPLANKKVLDIGCAEGAVALSAARMGARVTGLEPRQGRLTKARRAAEGMGLDVEFRKGFLDNLESRPGTFDVVLALNVVHHVPNPFAFLDQAASLTRSHLVLEYPGLVDEKYRRTL
ncbi:MAG TPA: methyltransferase domain-containing protein, partial [Marmoricola sp.]|nr:methyltransferase domain-containing protein [Marmoricola sp.]